MVKKYYLLVSSNRVEGKFNVYIISNQMLRTDDLITMPTLIIPTFDCILKGLLPMTFGTTGSQVWICLVCHVLIGERVTLD